MDYFLSHCLFSELKTIVSLKRTCGAFLTFMCVLIAPVYLSGPGIPSLPRTPADRRLYRLGAQLGPTLSYPVDCSPPGSSVHGISHARILEWVAISFSKRSFQPKVGICVSCISRQMFYYWATREACRQKALRDNTELRAGQCILIHFPVNKINFKIEKLRLKYFK